VNTDDLRPLPAPIRALVADAANELATIRSTDAAATGAVRAIKLTQMMLEQLILPAP
jgi:hypothetical protein